MAPTPAEPVTANDDGTTDILIVRGSTLTLAITHAGLADPTGYTARMMLREQYTDTDPLLSLDSEDVGGITLAAVSGGTLITVTATATQTAALDARSAKYDLELVSAGGVVTKPLLGKAYIRPEATK